MGHEETPYFNNEKLNKNNWEVDIFDGIPLEDACDIGISHYLDSGLKFNVFILGNRGMNTVTWETNPSEPKINDYFVITDTIKDANFRARGERISVELGNYILILPYDADGTRNARLHIYRKNIMKPRLDSIKKELKSHDIKVHTIG